MSSRFGGGVVPSSGMFPLLCVPSARSARQELGTSRLGFPAEGKLLVSRGDSGAIPQFLGSPPQHG